MTAAMGGITRDKVLAVIEEQLLLAVVDVAPTAIGPEAELAALGLDSIDRMDLVVATVEALGIDPPLHLFGSARSLGELATLVHQQVTP
ncbi:acyl carrier protein [Kutzneria sp. NPDC052558]|uniref:acyl carrier protein n=1 Tax=Kutzneria sp. NPDC052558 TaxID=3364121 RepID=UPI0037C7381F